MKRHPPREHGPAGAIDGNHAALTSPAQAQDMEVLEAVELLPDPPHLAGRCTRPHARAPACPSARHRARPGWPAAARRHTPSAFTA